MSPPRDVSRQISSTEGQRTMRKLLLILFLPVLPFLLAADWQTNYVQNQIIISLMPDEVITAEKAAGLKPLVCAQLEQEKQLTLPIKVFFKRFKCINSNTNCHILDKIELTMEVTKC